MTPELPEIHEALLDDATLRTLLSDIEQFGTSVSISVRRPTGTTQEEAYRNPRAVEPILLGTTPAAVQIRYSHDGKAWCDSLRPTPTGVRLIRIES